MNRPEGTKLQWTIGTAIGYVIIATLGVVLLIVLASALKTLAEAIL